MNFKITPFICSFLFLLLTGCSRGFSDAEILEIERDIKVTYEKDGWYDINVTLVRESDTQLTGFINGKKEETEWVTKYDYFRRPYRTGSPKEVKLNLKCIAKKDIKSEKSFWECGKFLK